VGWMVTVHELGTCAELQPMKIVKKFAAGAAIILGDLGLTQVLLDKIESELADAGISELTIFDKEVGTELYSVMHAACSAMQERLESIREWVEPSGAKRKRDQLMTEERDTPAKKLAQVNAAIAYVTRGGATGGPPGYPEASNHGANRARGTQPRCPRCGTKRKDHGVDGASCTTVCWNCGVTGHGLHSCSEPIRPELQHLVKSSERHRPNAGVAAMQATAEGPAQHMVSQEDLLEICGPALLAPILASIPASLGGPKPTEASFASTASEQPFSRAPSDPECQSGGGVWAFSGVFDGCHF
jgi:hypothetical protein